jgi:Domain of unknown function (DUF4340)
MNTGLAERRKARAFSLLMIAGAVALVAAVTVGIQYRALRPQMQAGPVVPGLAETIGQGQRILIVSAEASYRIERVQRGAEQVWVMRDRDDYPVSRARLDQLTAGLRDLRFERRMTSDPSKHERLGVTDPREGGRGVLVQIEDGRQALLVNLILGIEAAGPSGGLYVRRPEQDQAWVARGSLPPLRDIAAWLDLQPLAIAPERLQRVEISPPTSRAYVLARDSADAPWRIAAPALAPGSQGALAAAAEAITHLTPVDVRTAPAIQGPVRARVRVATFDGIALEGELIEAETRMWLKLVARAVTPAQEPAALELNNRVAAWAYELNSFGADQLTPPLSNLVQGAP